MLLADFEFDDDLFGQTRQRSKPLLHSYNPKNCAPRWFEDESNAVDTETAFFYKFRGDLAFRDQSFRSALDNYTKSKASLSTSNTTVIRDVDEGICRCCSALGDQQKAAEAAERVWQMSFNFEQKTSALNLLFFLHVSCGHNEDALESLIQLTLLHPANPDLWIKLAFCYVHVAQSSLSDDFTDANQLEATFGELPGIAMPPQLVVCTCFVRAKRLLMNVCRNVSSFVHEKNIASQKQIEIYLEQLHLPSEQIEACQKWVKRQTVFSKEEDEGPIAEERVVPNVQILDSPKEIMRTEFESKWFMWYSVT